MISIMDIRNALELLDWKRRILDLYTLVRTQEPQEAWIAWRATRDEMFATHSQSAIAPERRDSFVGLDYFDYDPGMRTIANAAPTESEAFEVGASDGSSYAFTRIAAVSFDVASGSGSLDVFWLEGYGGGLFIPFADATSGESTYGGGRYLFDTVKGTDLGSDDNGLVLDFNFAYQPSCSYDSRWSCPLAPPGNRLTIPVEAGERLTTY
jgi:uncharacterized protein (DUF1684 family)